jgi:biopolymer transport protein ExbB
MPGVMHYLQEGDAVTRGLAVLLLAMSVLTWCLALGKAWALASVRRTSRVAIAGFWAAPSLPEAIDAISRLDREHVFAPLALAAVKGAGLSNRLSDASLGARAARTERILRGLRTALLVSQRRLEAGQTLLATIGSVSPFVGLLGTVWGIYHALIGIAGSGQPSISDVAGPVGEALIMTALGLAVAIPAVVAYNLLGRRVRAGNDALDGFARDLHAFLSSPEGTESVPVATAAPAAQAEARDGIRRV